MVDTQVQGPQVHKPMQSTTVASAKDNTPATVAAENRIRERAYELYERRGGELGQDEQDWLRAEQEIIESGRATKSSAA